MENEINSNLSTGNSNPGGEKTSPGINAEGSSIETKGEVQGHDTPSGDREQSVSERKANPNFTPTEPTLEQRIEMIEKFVQDSNEQGIIAFNSFTIKKQSPTVYGVLLKWMNETAHIGGQIDDETAAGVLLYAPRSVLFNFFDSQDIFVNALGKYGKWSYTIDGAVKIPLVGGTYKTRTTAEYDAFMKAFQILETDLVALF